MDDPPARSVWDACLIVEASISEEPGAIPAAARRDLCGEGAGNYSLYRDRRMLDLSESHGET